MATMNIIQAVNSALHLAMAADPGARWARVSDMVETKRKPRLR